MGTDDLFKKRRKARKQREFGFRKPKANSFLIVTEGSRTEPLYFGGIKKKIEDKLGGNIDVIEVPRIEICGGGCSTGKLIEKTDEIVNKSNIMYQNIWVVFDKDDFNDFDEAIKLAHDKGYHVAWSNQSFEYWIYLHFNYSDAALHRAEWNKKLDELFQQYQLGNGKYEKNYENIYEMLEQIGGVDTAVKYAKSRMAGFREQIDKPSEYNPGTMVYKLVKELKTYLNE